MDKLTFYITTDPDYWLYARNREEGRACAEAVLPILQRAATENQIYCNFEISDELIPNVDSRLKIIHLAYRSIPFSYIEETALKHREEEEKERKALIREKAKSSISIEGLVPQLSEAQKELLERKKRQKPKEVKRRTPKKPKVITNPAESLSSLSLS